MKTHRLFELRVSMNNDNSLKQISQHKRDNFSFQKHMGDCPDVLRKT